MFSNPKSLKYKYLVQIIAIIILMYKKNKWYMQIDNYLKVAKSIVISNINCHNN